MGLLAMKKWIKISKNGLFWQNTENERGIEHTVFLQRFSNVIKKGLWGKTTDLKMWALNTNLKITQNFNQKVGLEP